MAEIYPQASIAFVTCAFEATLVEEAFLAAQDWDHAGVTFDPSAPLCSLFPPARPGEPWSGLQGIFDDPDSPTFGAKIIIGEVDGHPRLRCVRIYSLVNFQVGPIAELIRVCCQSSLLARPIGFDYALSCSGPLPGMFGGGWCVIWPDRVDRGSTAHALASAIRPDG